MIGRLLSNSIPEPNSGCWIWLGHIKRNGYGTLGVKIGDKWKTKHAHRVSYEAFIGKPPIGLDLDHKCRIRCCINPEHLEPVTRTVNLSRSPLMNRQTNKYHCPEGHPYSGVDNRGARICHACNAVTMRRFRAKKGDVK